MPELWVSPPEEKLHLVVGTTDLVRWLDQHEYVIYIVMLAIWLGLPITAAVVWWLLG